MKKIKNHIVVLSLILTFVLTIVGCSPSTNKETLKENKEIASQDKKEKTDIVEEENIEPFEKKYLKEKGLKADGTPLKIGMDFADLKSEYVINLSEYAKLLLEKSGAETIITTSNMDVKLQDSKIDDFIQEKVDAVIIHAVDTNGSATAIKRLNEAGIPVICVIRNVEGVKMDLYISTSDNIKTGEKAANYLVEKADGKDVKITSVQGYMGASDAYLREEGYENIVAEYENLNYFSQNPCEWDTVKAEASISDAITAEPDLWGILAHSDCMAPGVYSALRQAEKAYKINEEGHIYWASIDGAPFALDMIRQGYMDVTVEQSPLSVATFAVKGILEYVAVDKEIGEQVVDVETSIITIDNVEDPGLWGNYIVKTGAIWNKTEEVWNSKLK